MLEVDVPNPETGHLADPEGSRRQDCHYVAVRRVPSGLDDPRREPPERGHVREREIARAGRLVRCGGAADRASASAVARRVPTDEPVTDSLIQDQDQDCDGVLDGRPAVRLLPAIDCAVDKAGADQRYRKMPERRQDPGA